MIRIDLVDDSTSVKHINFLVVPVTSDKDFACNPDGILPFSAVLQLSRKLKAGRTVGRVGKFVWYRLIGAPPGPTTDQQ